MGWRHCLIDALWDTQIGYDKIKELCTYAATKGVKVHVWYNSNGDWNAAPQTPSNKMLTRESRLKEFAKPQGHGRRRPQDRLLRRRRPADDRLLPGHPGRRRALRLPDQLPRLHAAARLAAHLSAPDDAWKRSAAWSSSPSSRRMPTAPRRTWRCCPSPATSSTRWISPRCARRHSQHPAPHHQRVRAGHGGALHLRHPALRRNPRRHGQGAGLREIPHEGNPQRLGGLQIH